MTGTSQVEASEVMMTTLIEQAGRVAHEANRAYCVAISDFSVPAWDLAPKEMRDSVLNGVRFHIANPSATPEDSHDNWLRFKHAEGWTWGPFKDAEAKKHPCMQEYALLPQKQRAKDYIFRAVVHTLLGLRSDVSSTT